MHFEFVAAKYCVNVVDGHEIMCVSLQLIFQDPIISQYHIFSNSTSMILGEKLQQSG